VSTLGKRLVALEARMPVGCSTCRSWSRAVYEDDQGNRTRPERGPDCGRLVPMLLIRVVYGVPLEAV
jgi:hypothetical protein